MKGILRAMNKFFIAIIFTFFTISSVWAQAENYRYSAEVDSAGTLMLSMRIGEAELMMNRFIEAHPDDPAGYFYRSRLSRVGESSSPRAVRIFRRSWRCSNGTRSSAKVPPETSKSRMSISPRPSPTRECLAGRRP